MTKNDRPDDALQDAHLRLALRHAPDGDTVAPAHLSAQIIAAAHRAAAEAAPQPQTQPGRWQRLGQALWGGKLARWGSSGALASVLMAVVLGVMWQGDLPGPAVEREVAMAPASPPSPSPAPAPFPAVVQPAPAAKAEARAKVAAEREQARSTLNERADLPAQDANADQARPRLAASAQQRAVEAQRLAESMRAADTQRRVAAAAPEPASPVQERPAPAAAMAPPSPPPPPSPPAPARLAQGDAATETATPPRAEANRVARAFSAAPQPAATQSLRAAAPAAVRAAPSFGAWLRALPPTLQWQSGTTGQVVPSEAWLQALAAQADGRWEPAPGPAPTATSTSLRLAEGSSAPVAGVWLLADRVWWCQTTLHCWQVVLGSEALVALRESLPR